jgi:hypothetical protein
LKVLVDAPRYIWTEEYQAAIFEVDLEKMKNHATKAEELILRRRGELLREPSPDADEVEAIARALAALAVLKGIADKNT